VTAMMFVVTGNMLSIVWGGYCTIDCPLGYWTKSDGSLIGGAIPTSLPVGSAKRWEEVIRLRSWELSTGWAKGTWIWGVWKNATSFYGKLLLGVCAFTCSLVSSSSMRDNFNLEFPLFPSTSRSWRSVALSALGEADCFLTTPSFSRYSTGYDSSNTSVWVVLSTICWMISNTTGLRWSWSY
jgi:hypothetical protein